MKKSTQNAVLALLLCLLASGCAMYGPQSFWEVTKTEVDLEANNFKVRKLGAQGNAMTPVLFGIPLGGGAVAGIPLEPMDIQARAMKALHRNWDGRGAVFLHNINVEWTDYGVPGIFIFHQNTITADIYEFDAPYVDYGTR
jgi:hypothetical protein